MEANVLEQSVPRSPLRDFVRDYVDVVGGVLEEIEPQVYDVLLPSAGAGEVLVTFDPEALPDYPQAQLASFGTPLVDHWLADALRRGRFAQFYLVGLNLAPHDLAGRLRRSLTLDSGLELRRHGVRPLHFAQAVYWFEATFVSDQKEQEIVPVALDLHYRRQVRHLEELLDPARLADRPARPLAEARRAGVAAAYPLARERVVRTLSALANTRSRELQERLGRQIARMTRYYADLRAELEEQRRRAEQRGEDAAKVAARRLAVDREEQLRVTELRQKSTLRIQLRLLHLVVVQQPKLLVRATVASSGGREVGTLELVWDPLIEALEAVPCPQCERPTLILHLTRQGLLVCPACAASPPTHGGPGLRKGRRGP